jgi:hypothetical protein
MSSLRATGGADADPYLYLDPPVLDASGLLALGQALLDGSPISPPSSLLGPLRRLRQACEDIQTALRQAREVVTPAIPPRQESRQPADFALDTAWTALYERLRAYVMLPESEVPRVKRAHELLRLLFPDALGFLRLPYEAEWAESDKRLRSVEKLSLGADLDAVAGPEFIVEVRRAHDLYSRALGRRNDGSSSSDNERPHGKDAVRDSGKDKEKDKDKDKDKDARDSGENPALRDLRLHLARCISAYALKILALTPDDVKDFQAVKRWLAPLSAYQRAESRKGAANHALSSPAAASAIPAGSHPHSVSRGPAPAPPPSSPSLHDWASGLRASDSSGDHRPLSDSGLVRTSFGAARSTPATPANAGSNAAGTGSGLVPPRSSPPERRDEPAPPRSSPPPATTADSRLGGQSGTYRPVGESGLFRPIKRPPT